LLSDIGLFLFASLQLWPFLGVFHQSADENVLHYLLLLLNNDHWEILRQVRLLAEQQGRIGIFLATPLELLGVLLPEFALGRMLSVGCFGLLLLYFCRLLAVQFRTPLTRPAFLLTLCLTPMAAHHLPPNSYPLLVTVPLLALVGLHLHLARPAASFRWSQGLALAMLIPLTLILEYAFVAGLGLTILAIAAAEPERRLKVALQQGAALSLSLAIYLGYRVIFPSNYAGNTLGAPGVLEVVGLQGLHAINGTVLPRLFVGLDAGSSPLLTSGVFVIGTWLCLRVFLEPLRNIDPKRLALIASVCLGWAWLNTLPHALTAKYQDWCRVNNDCTYVDSRIAALSFGVLAAIGIALVMHVLYRRMAGGGRWAGRLCAGAVGILGTLTFLQNRGAAHDMVGQQQAFSVIREASCRPDGGIARDVTAVNILARTVAWHSPSADSPTATRYLMLYRDSLARLGLTCRPTPFEPATAVGFLGWATPEPGGRWSVGEGAVLRLQGQGKEAGTLLRIRAYVPPGSPPQRVLFRTGEGPGCEILLSENALNLLVPWTADDRDRKLAVMIETPDAISPSAAGASIDQRKLGVFLSSARAVKSVASGLGSIDLRRCGKVE
jgi:hypothetical protein